eukprot:3941009-Rhodomonas_salina.1
MSCPILAYTTVLRMRHVQRVYGGTRCYGVWDTEMGYGGAMVRYELSAERCAAAEGSPRPVPDRLRARKGPYCASICSYAIC